MGFIFGILKRLLKFGLLFAIFAAAIVFIPNLPPYTQFSTIIVEPTQPLEGPLALNNALNNPEKLYIDKVLGPEAFELYNGELYTSLASGEVVKISPGGHVTFVTKIGQPCTDLVQAEICGRPLGLQIDGPAKKLYVSDAYHGIWKVDLGTDKKQLLVSPRVEIEGRKPKIFNSIALAKNGDLYWTDSSSDFLLKDGVYTTLADPSGRLFQYVAAKNESKVLLDNLWFPNGVALSPDNQFLVVAETLRMSLTKYYIAGPKKGKSEVFISGLPGTPDNVRALPDGSGLTVGLYSSFEEGNPVLLKSLAPTPLVRKFLARMQRLLELPFEVLNNYYPHPVLERVVYDIGHFKGLAPLLSGQAGLLHLDWNGKIVGAYYNTDGSVPAISDAVVFNGKLYTGCPDLQNYIAAVPAPPALLKAYSAIQITPPETKPVRREAPIKEEAKPVKPKPVEKPKVEVKKETPKPVEKKPEPKPVERKPDPKPVEKKAETKPVEKKPVEKKPETKPIEKKTEPKPVEKKAEPKPTPTPTPKPQIQQPAKETKPTTPPPKQERKPEAKPSPAPAANKVKLDEAKKVKEPVKKLPEQIPIKEDIPSDTVKPEKEPLKVIKKGGPTEIPNF